jgi:hypothetical protein
MKLLITAFIAILSSSVLIAQPGELKKIEHNLYLGKNGMTITDFFALINVDKEKFFNDKAVDGGAVYYIREYDDYKKLSFSTTWFDYILLVDNNSEEILYSNVEISGIKSAGEDVFKQYHASFQTLLEKHEMEYEIKIDLENENMSPLTNFVFGTGCGWDGPLPQKGIEMFEMVKKGDETTLISWTKSMNPAIQCYGVMGLYFMEKNGVSPKLKKKDIKIIEMVKAKKTVIDYCSNIELNSTTSMNAVLNDFYLDTIWDLYKDSKYVK